PAADGPKSYEAENGTAAGGATVYDCACSNGKKVGFLGGSGYVVMPTVTVATAGTYLMQLSYLDGDSSRTGILTVNGTSQRLPVRRHTAMPRRWPGCSSCPRSPDSRCSSRIRRCAACI